jgi:hypothetical protein
MLLPGETLTVRQLADRQGVSRGHSRQAWYEPKDELRKSSELNYPGYPTTEMQTKGLNA